MSFPEETEGSRVRIPTHPVVRFVKVLSRSTLLVTFVIFLVVKYVVQPALATTLERRFELQNFAFMRLKGLKKRLDQTVELPPFIKVAYGDVELVDRTTCTDDIKIEEARESQYEFFKKDSKRRSYNVQFTDETGAKTISSKEKSNEDLSTFTELNSRIDHSQSKLQQKIIDLKSRLAGLNVVEYQKLSPSGFSDGDLEMNSLLYQLKQLKNYMEVMTSEHPREMLFKKPISQIQVGRNRNTSVKFNYLDVIDDKINGLKNMIDEKTTKPL